MRGNMFYSTVFPDSEFTTENAKRDVGPQERGRQTQSGPPEVIINGTSHPQRKPMLTILCTPSVIVN